MPAAAAEIAVRLASNAGLPLGYGLDQQPGVATQFVKSAARDGITAAIDHNGCFEIIGGRDATDRGGPDGSGENLRVGLVAKNSDECGSVDYQRGSPSSS